ncbi:MAG TPA: redox-regulated ATPase YchF [Tenuifilaceae bacterium]|nr:redox-regulated ATPase YchF [Bacteroidales bacterium]MDI9515893.1 redox-regulated ATPase YchF [Bacteroidota bacterium]NLH56051.1 redox-regulated ATPase YchF [Rikenellaceae bacterium]OQC61545.1 MAG: Ribosome-binding ATPase YchF [Bacteroidetes bacterium ADurb.Bin008]HNV82135.1 redox-regulated ATPase YchF [Tenuifilaceae bacterium]
MSLQCGIIGITNVGKSTIFNCMSKTKAETSSFSFGSKTNLSIINVPDERLKELNKYQETERIVHATVEIVDIPGLTKSSGRADKGANQFLADIRNCDALIHVLRCFDDANLPHVDGSVNPVRDIETVNLELQIKDLESVEKKIAKLEKLVKVGDKDAKHGLEVLNKYKEHLESFQNASSAPVSEEDKKYVADLFLISTKPIIYVCNVDEASALNGNAYVEQVREYLKDEPTEILIIAGKIEADIAELDEEEDRKEFLKEVGLLEPGVNKLIRAAYSLLDLETFFTVGPKEIRAWTIKRGVTASKAAGVIHSDLERGFIRAEVMKYDDFVTLGSEHACKEKGKLSVEGKNYIVQDGDILHIRFNV